MNQKEMPIPYIGEKPYIFVSYAHKDSEVVMRAIALLQQSGFRVKIRYLEISGIKRN